MSLAWETTQKQDSEIELLFSRFIKVKRGQDLTFRLKNGSRESPDDPAAEEAIFDLRIWRKGSSAQGDKGEKVVHVVLN